MRDHATFAALGRSKHRVRCGPLTVAWIAGEPDQPPRVAYAVGRRVGNAVVRNRVRRRLRAVIAELQPEPGAYLFVVRREATALSPKELKALVSSALHALSRMSPTSQ